MLPVERPEGKRIVAIVFLWWQGEEHHQEHLSSSHLVPLSKAAELALADFSSSALSLNRGESEHVIVHLQIFPRKPFLLTLFTLCYLSG